MANRHEIRLTDRPLDAAAIVPSSSIDPNVVTMNSTVVLEACPSGERTTLTLVYPKDADPAQLPGVGACRRWVVRCSAPALSDLLRVLVPGHGEREFRLLELSYQPEANGRFDL